MQNDSQPSWNNPQHDEHNTVPIQQAYNVPQSADFYTDHTVPFPQGTNAATPSPSFEQGPIPDQGSIPPYQGTAQGAAPYQQPPANTVPPVRPAAVQPQPKRSNKVQLFIGGAIVLVLVILGIIGITFLPSLTTQSTAQGTTATPVAQQTPVATAKSTGKNIYASYLNLYKATIRSQIAQGLHLTAAQLGSQLSAGQTLQEIAATQNVTASQLQTIVKNAFQNGFQPALDSGNLTQKQVNTLINRMLKQPQTLDRYLAIKAKQTSGGTHNATPTAQAGQV